MSQHHLLQIPPCPEEEKRLWAQLARNLCVAYCAHARGTAMSTEDRKTDQYRPETLGPLWYALARFLAYRIPASLEAAVFGTTTEEVPPQ